VPVCTIYALLSLRTLLCVTKKSFKMSAKYLKRYKAVFLVLHAKGSKLTYAQASKVLRKSKSFVEKWVKQYKEVANVDDLLNRGLSRTTTSRGDKTIVHLFEQNPTLTLRQARNQLLEKGINIGINTIRRRLYESKIHKISFHYQETSFNRKTCHKTTGMDL